MRLALIPLSLILCAATADAQNCTTEDFEGPAIPLIQNLGTTALNSLTVIPALGGSGLVEPGSTYTTTGQDLLWWDAPTFLVDKCISSTFSAEISIEYDNDVDSMSVQLNGFFADTIDAHAYDAGGTLIASQLGIPVAALSSSTVSFSGGGIRKVEFLSALTGGDSAFIGSHTYCGSSGPQLTLTGACPGAGVLDGSGMTANAPVTIAWSFTAGSWVIPAASAVCGGTTIGIVSPTVLLSVQADQNGDFTLPVNLPAGACGVVHAQGVDRASCTPTNVLSI